jgi:polyisoprenoid-binding protein YceI
MARYEANRLMMKKLKTLLFAFLFWQALTLLSQQTDFHFYAADTLHSKIYWKCDKHKGTFKLKKGGFVTYKGKIVDGLFFIDLHSMKDLDMDKKTYGTAVMILENTLKNEFLEVEKYPYSYFRLESLKHIKNNLYQVVGDFTLHGITNCIEFTAQIDYSGNKIHFVSKPFVIDRSEWGVYRMSPTRFYSDDENNWTVPDEVEIKIDITAIKEE